MKQSRIHTGTVALLNIHSGIGAVLVDDGEYTIIEMLDEVGLALGDMVSGTLGDLGDGTLTNHTTGMTGQVWIDDIYLDRNTAITVLKGR